jgi:hypothetical protein
MRRMRVSGLFIMHRAEQAQINPWGTIDMEKVFTVLGWFAMASLALAIARQLSEQKNLGTFSAFEGFENAPQGCKKAVAN